MKKRKATAGSVSALLGKKFRRAESSASPIRGVRNQHAGFEVKQARRIEGSPGYAAEVLHVCSWSQRDNRTNRINRIKQRLKEYAEYLEPHYNVVNYGTHLTVTEKTDG